MANTPIETIQDGHFKVIISKNKDEHGEVLFKVKLFRSRKGNPDNWKQVKKLTKLAGHDISCASVLLEKAAKRIDQLQKKPEPVSRRKKPHKKVLPKSRSRRRGDIDGRTLRKTGRTAQFSTRVSPEWKKELYALAKRTGKKYNIILEEALELFIEKNPDSDR